MATKPANNPVHIANCDFSANAAPANEHTRAAIEAIAAAMAAQARANQELAISFGKVADALKGGDASFGTGISINNS